MSDNMKHQWEKVEQELRTAMSKLKEAIEKALVELPDAA